MERRNDLMRSKRKELESEIEQYCRIQKADDTQIIEVKHAMFDSCIIMTPPEQEPPVMHMLVMSSLSDYKRGTSIKPGNIKINMKKLIDTLPESVEAGVALAMDIPILKVCAALHIWKMIRNVMSVEITKEQAVVIMSLWKNADERHIISLEKGWDCANRMCRQTSNKEFTQEWYTTILEELERIDSIKVNEDGIWLCEWVAQRYRS
ncbi:hypothetical protein AAAU98_11885 [Enterocloster citroniae]|uniref:hypothetical protein n=1 Tax=Enterocloster citroniae TaxID=358743 RepID=UPI0032C1A958|nr:hypothetical protein [Clostridium sp.]